MKIDLEEKSKEIKHILSKYEVSWFLGNLSNLIDFIGKGAQDQLGNLKSPLRQLTYLGGLNITSAEGANEIQYSNEEWDNIVKLLNDIEVGYDQMFDPKEGEEINDNWIENRKVVMPAFMSYFNQGPLNYEEQVIERIEKYFSVFDTEIVAKIGISVKDLIDIYNFIDELHHLKRNDVMKPKPNQQTWEEFGQEMIEKGINPDKWMDFMPEQFTTLFNFMHDGGVVKRFSKDEISAEFGEEKAAKFLDFITLSRAETDFLYYSEPNQLQFTPIFKIENNKYQVFSHVYIIHGIYNNLIKLITSDNRTKERFYKKRGDELENKIIEIFRHFFKDKAQIFKSYYTDEGHEQDILVLFDNVALIIEAKASKRDEPRRDPNRAYPILKSNFDEVIQKGYDQTYRVKKYFLGNNELNIYRDLEKKHKIISINTKKYRNAYSIIITLDRFAQLQTDLDLLLNIDDENDSFPWSVCIDDLEVFLLALIKLGGNSKNKLYDFLSLREWLHGGLICADELEVCADFLHGRFNKHKIKDDSIVITTPHSPDLFDKLYRKGLGFNNEKQIERKKSDKYLSF